jgi:hypothetical protein
MRLRGCVVALALLAPTAAAAQAPPAPPVSAAQQDLARSKARQGLRLFGAERFQEAYEVFREAAQIVPAPSVTLYVARCQRKLGKLLEARDTYEQLVAERLPPDAPAAFLEAQHDARNELGSLRQSIPSIRVVVTGVPSGAAVVKLGGAPLPEPWKELNPGTYTVTASARGAEELVRTVHLAERESQTVELPFKVRSDASVGRFAGPAPAHAASPPQVSRSLVPVGLSFGAGAVGLGVGAVTGALALGKVNDLKSRCQGTVCPGADREDADTAGLFGDVSTVAFIVGGAGTAAGVMLLLLRPDSDNSAAAQGVTLQAGVGRLDLRGSF